MRFGFGLALLSAAAAGLAGAAPANATAYTINLRSSTDSALDGTEGLSFTRSDASNTISVKATAWTQTGNNFDDAYLGRYKNGLGVTNGLDGNGSSGKHSIDNKSGNDFILLQFNKPVALTNIVRAVYTVSNSTDGDAFYRTATKPGSPVAWDAGLNAGSLNYGTRYSLPTSQTGGFNNAQVKSSIWAVGADFFAVDSHYDGFKLSALTVQYTAPIITRVPEPATWGMMILGFGFVGVALRRRRPTALAA